MCGRFTQRLTWREIHELYGLTGVARNLQPHYNIAPTDTVDVVRLADAGATELVPMRWGLIPYWWKKPLKELPATFNARAESVADKPMFRDAFTRHRCIIPAAGYYEWIARPEGKQRAALSGRAVASTGAQRGERPRWQNVARRYHRKFRGFTLI